MYLDAHGVVRLWWHSVGTVFRYWKSYSAVRCCDTSYGAVRCGFRRCGSVRFSDVVNPRVRFGCILCRTVRFGAVFRYRQTSGTVRCGAVNRTAPHRTKSVGKTAPQTLPKNSNSWILVSIILKLRNTDFGRKTLTLVPSICCRNAYARVYLTTHS